MTTVGKASIEIEVDGSGISRSLEDAMDRALAAVSKSAGSAFGKVERDASAAGDEIGAGIGDGAKAAERALSSIDTDGIDNIGKAASSAADAVSKSSADAADSLSDVGAAGAEAGATASGAMSASMADISQAAASSGAAAADSLSGVGGAAAESAATASSSMASSMSDVSASAASAFSGVSASAADAAAGVAASAANMSSSMADAMSSVSASSANVSDGLGGVGGKLGDMTRKLGPAAAGMAGLAGAGVTVKAGFDKLTSIEDTTASLGIILGDLDAASSLMAQLQEDNLSTPYMFDAYAAAGKTLAAFGADLEGIPEQVQALGEAAAASGGGQQVFDSMARASGQAMATGKMSLDTINQLAVGGVQGLQILANHFDVPTSEMQKMISQGMVPAQEGMDILTQGILEGSDGIAGATQSMSGVMQEMSETTSGSMTNLVAAFTNLASAVLEPMIPAITAIADGMTDFAYAVIDLMGEDMPGWLRTTLDIAKPLGVTLGVLTGAVAGLVVQQKIATAGGFLKWLGTFSSVSKVATGVQTAFNAVMAANPIVLVTIAIAALVAGLAYFFTQTETGQRIWQGFMDALGTAWEWLTNVFSTVWDTVADAAVSAFEWLGEAWDTLWGGIQAVWDAVGQPVVDFVVAAFSLWWEGVQLYFRLLGAAWEVLWTGLQMAWDAFGQPVVDFVVAAFQMWWDGVQIIFGWVQDGWDLLWAGVRAVYDAVIAPVIGWVQDRFEDLRSAVRTVIDAVKGAIQEFADRVSALYDTYVQPMVDAVIGGFNRVRDTIQEWKDKIIGWFSDAGTWLMDAGKNIVNGIIDGVKSMAGELANAFLNIVPDWVKDPFMEALGIESPSKVFMGYGKSIGEGLVEGIEGMQGAVGDAVTDLTDSAAPGDLPPMPVAMALEAGSAPLGAPLEGAGAPYRAEVADGGGGAQGDNGELVDLGDSFGDSIAESADVVDPALLGMQENLALLGEEALLQGGVMSEAMLAASTGIQDAKTGLFDPAQQGMRDSLELTAATTQAQMLGTALPAMQQTGAGVVDVQNKSVAPALENMQGAINNTAGVFATGTNRMTTEFNKVREGTAAPVRYTISTVFNDGLVGMWNNVSDMVGLDKMNTYPLRFASGGVLPGYTPGRDVHRFFSPTGGLLDLSGGEAIMRPEFTRAVGTAGIDRLNRIAAQGGVSGLGRAFEHMNLGGYAGGGVLPYLGGFNPGGVIYGGGYGGLTPITRTHAEWVGKHFPNMFTLTSALRFTDSGYHSTGRATDWQAQDGQYATQMPTPASKAMARAMYATFPNAAELIHWPLDGWRNIWHGQPHNYDAGTNSQHANHVHFATQGPIQGGALGLTDYGGGAIVVDPRQIIESMMGDDLTRVSEDAHAFKGMGGYVDKIPGAVYDSMIGPMMDTLEEAFMTFGGDPGGEGVARWRPLAMQALARHGYDPESHIDAMLQQIQFESGGNPQALNLWDSNALAGIPSGGLLQVIEPTYRRVRAAYPDAFAGLPDDRWHPLTNLVAGVGAVRMDWGGPGGRWPTRAGYDLGGLADGIGLMPKHILDPERVLSPRQTEAFEAWMDAGARVEDINKLVEAVTWREDPANLPVVQPEKVLNADQEAVFDEWRGQGSQIDSIHGLVDSMHGLQLDHPDVMGREIDRRFRAWLGDAPEDNTGDVRHLVAALESGVEWERVTRGMQRSAEAWANGQWVQVAEDKRLATPDEMGQQLSENFLEELADELGGYVGLRGLYKGRDIVGESGLVKLELPDEVKDAEIVPSTEGAPVVATATPTATGKTTAGEAQNVEVTVNIDVSGVNDPMAVSDLVMAKVGKGVEEAIGTARSQ